MKKLTATLTGMVLGLVLAVPAFAADKKAMPEAKTLFTNVNVFDGKSEKRVMNANVLNSRQNH